MDSIINVEGSIAFFDVDETLIRRKSMFDFMLYFFKKKNGWFGVLQCKLYWRVLKIISLFGGSRNTVNRLYYRFYKGSSYVDLIEIGKQWYDQQKSEPSFFVKEVVDRLFELSNKGYKIVFVSGSFRPCLDPLANELNVKIVLCSELEVKRGVVTGYLKQQAIGSDKATLVRNEINKSSADSKNCYAFGDHLSDLPMLEEVGKPVVVHNCKDLIKVANKNNWEQIIPS
jgi:HAD superfamily hydrolase (TIGR01490 family)